MARTIKEAEAACRAAWKPYKDNWRGKWGWCVHHSRLLEPLTESPGNRIDYILSSKAESEQLCRLDNFRPASCVLPDTLLKARAERDKAGAERHKAWAEYEKAGAKCDKAGAERHKAWAEYEKAGAERHKAWAEYEKAWAEYIARSECAVAHLLDVPDHTWNGKSIF